MPLPRRRCNRPHCPNAALPRRRYCQPHQAQHQATLDRRYPRRGRDIYNLPEWAELSRRIREENPTCQHCHRRPSTQVDHIIPLGHPDAPPPLEPSNLQALCNPCHGRKTWHETHPTTPPDGPAGG